MRSLEGEKNKPKHEACFSLMILFCLLVFLPLDHRLLTQMPTGARQVEKEGNILVCDDWEWWRPGQTAVLVTNLKRSAAVSAPVRWERRPYITKSQV